MPGVSAIVRSCNSAGTVVEALHSLRHQTLPVEIIVVDSGSTDATVELATALADRVVRIPPSRFTYGYALNAGAEAARGAMHMALSSHCRLPRRDWVEIAAEHLADDAVVAATGAQRCADGQELTGPLIVDHDYVERHPWWGMSNHASAWSASQWKDTPFDEDLIACEDKEWARRATRSGRVLVADRRLLVPVAHRRQQGTAAYLRRVRREIVALAQFADVPAFDMLQAVRQYGRRVPTDPYLTRSRPLGRTRLLDCVARWQAHRVLNGAAGHD